VEEGGLKFLVNLKDYIDSGLFLDHRDLRTRMREEARGKRFLNLFCYTGSASVFAASGGAIQTVSVDRSNTYLGWTEKNLRLNGYGDENHVCARADCLPWLLAPERKEEPRYDLIFADVPTYSNSKSARRDFDAQRDHAALISAAMRLLSKVGALYFSTHYKRFKLDTEALGRFAIKDISRETLPFDFRRTPRIRYCWRISHVSVS